MTATRQTTTVRERTRRRFWSIEEVCEEFGMSRSEAYRRMDLGHLQWVKVGRSRRIPTWAVEELERRFEEESGVRRQS